MIYKEYKGLDLSSIDKEILSFWQASGIFQKSIDSRPEDKRFVFYEGPPSANGLPGIHHVVGRTIKDIFCRYKTLQGYRVERKGGWDTHGLPVELKVEQELGITKEDIGTKISVEEYNQKCRETVMQYKERWDTLTQIMGFWLDLDHPYITFDNSYIESVWWILGQIYEKNLLYRGYTIQPYSPAAGTGLSTHELNQPGAYRDVTDTTIVACFEVVADQISKINTAFGTAVQDANILAWTTTPWTLPSNTALAVGAEIDYVLVSSFNPYTHHQQNYILAAALLSNVFLTIGFEVSENTDFRDAIDFVNNHKGEILNQEERKKRIELILGRSITENQFESLKFIVANNKQMVDINDYKNMEELHVFSIEDIKLLIKEKINHLNFTVPYRIIGQAKGIALEGINYHQLLPFESNLPARIQGNSFRVILGDFVTTTDGTGIVHIAPSFGADDRRVAIDNGIGELKMVDKEGKFIDGMGYLSGRYVKDYRDEAGYKSPDVDIAIDLKGRDRAWNVQKYVHSYPHCWRTDKPVIYYPLDSWFIQMTALKDRLIANNDKINWKPASTGTGRFGQWLENIQDWNLSRSRFWGIPLPIWMSSDRETNVCISSTADLFEKIELANASGLLSNEDREANKKYLELWSQGKGDLHKPYIDMVKLVSNNKVLSRESDVIDVWFDSGSMPYAQWNFPFSNTDKFEQSYPADFIAEGVDQTRGWFYTLHAISTILYDQPAYKNVISNGHVLDKNGEKMSKRKGNVIDPFETIGTMGADATRWYIISNASPWDSLKFDIKGVEEVRRKFFGTLYNTYSFFSLYANIDQFVMDESRAIALKDKSELDRWIISKLNSLKKEVEQALNDYEPTVAARLIENFVDRNLSNWYVRLSRRRFWKNEVSSDKQAAYETLYECLVTVAQLMSPIAPFFSEWLYQNLTQAIRSKAIDNNTPLRYESIHLTTWTAVAIENIDSELEHQIELAQDMTSLILSLRKKEQIKVRQPLQKIIVPILNEEQKKTYQGVEEIVKSETNIKEFEYVDENSGLFVKSAKANFKTLGKKLGKDMNAIAGQIAAMTTSDISIFQQNQKAIFQAGDNDYELTIEDIEISTSDMPGFLVASENGVTLALDITLTEDLLDEGIAREFVNKVQNYRKDQDYNVVDKINIHYLPDPHFERVLSIFKNYISNEVLAHEIVPKESSNMHEIELNDIKLKIEITKS